MNVFRNDCMDTMMALINTVFST